MKNILKLGTLVLGVVALSAFAFVTANEISTENLSAQSSHSTDLLAMSTVDFDDKCGEGTKSDKKESAKKADKKGKAKCCESKCSKGKSATKKETTKAEDKSAKKQE